MERSKTTSNPPARRWQTVKYSADYAATTVRTIYRWASLDLITIYRAPTGMRRVDLNEIDQLLAPLTEGSVCKTPDLSSPAG